MKKISKELLTTIIAVGVAVVLVVAMFVPTIVSLTKNNKKMDNVDLQIEEFKTQIASLSTSDGITAADLEAALNKIVIPEAGLTEAQVKAIVEAALEGLDGLTEEEVGALITEALAGIDTGLTEEQVKNIIDNAIAGIEIPDPGLTAEEIKAIVDEAVAGIDIPEAGLTEEQIRDIINEALEGIDTGLTEEELRDIIADILNGQINELETGLATGGTLSLIGNVSLEDVTVPAGVTSTLNLNGYTLTVSDTWEILGTLAVTNGKVIIEKPDNENDVYMKGGLCVEEGGTLTIEDVDIIGRRLWNVENNGTLTLIDSKLDVQGGYGLGNKGTAVVKNCTLIANGEATTQIYSIGGTMSVIETELFEGSDFVSYYYLGAIEIHHSEVTLEDVTVTTDDEYSVFAGTDSTAVVKSGTISDKIVCVGDETSVTIYGGTINGVAYESITADSAIFAGANFKLTAGEDCWTISK